MTFIRRRQTTFVITMYTIARSRGERDAPATMAQARKFIVSLLQTQRSSAPLLLFLLLILLLTDPHPTNHDHQFPLAHHALVPPPIGAGCYYAAAFRGRAARGGGGAPRARGRARGHGRV